jgi:mannose-1-phosphate guanylyltransferase
MKAILLAAGLGTRLKPLTDTVPKCLVLINDIPLLQIWLEKLFSSNIDSILINTHHLSNKVFDFINNSKFKDRVHLVHESTLLGTAGTVFANHKFIGERPIMVIHADNLSKFDMNDFIKAHQNRPSHCNMTMMLFEADDPKSCGIVELDKLGVVKGFHEKSLSPPSNLANAAIYIIEPNLISEYCAKNQKITDISTELIPSNLGKIYTYLNTQYHRDLGTIESLRLANIEYKV